MIDMDLQDFENKVIWFDLMDSKDAFEVMHHQWRLIIDKLVHLKNSNELPQELYHKVLKEHTHYVATKFPHCFPQSLSI